MSGKRKRFTEAEEEAFWRDYDAKELARNSISGLVARELLVWFQLKRSEGTILNGPVLTRKRLN